MKATNINSLTTTTGSHMEYGPEGPHSEDSFKNGIFGRAHASNMPDRRVER
jgi:hypothetical protein